MDCKLSKASYMTMMPVHNILYSKAPSPPIQCLLNMLDKANTMKIQVFYLVATPLAISIHCTPLHQTENIN